MERYVEICILDSLPITGGALLRIKEDLTEIGWHVGIRFSPLYSYQGGDKVRCANWTEIDQKRGGHGTDGNGCLKGDRLILIGCADRYGIAEWHDLKVGVFETMKEAQAALCAEWEQFVVANRLAQQETALENQD